MSKQRIHANGKDDRKQYRSLDEVWGDSGMNKFGTLDPSVFRAKLQSLNKYDLNEFSVTVASIQPSENRERLESTLMKIFMEYRAKFVKPDIKPIKQTVPTKEVADILAVGR